MVELPEVIGRRASPTHGQAVQHQSLERSTLRLEAQYAPGSGACSVRVGLLLLCLAIAACGPGAHGNGEAASATPSVGKTSAGAGDDLPLGRSIGLVMSSFEWLYGESKDDERAECPQGLNHTNREQWEAQFPTQAARRAHLGRCLDIRNRGPNCENVWFNPDVIEDPLPFREMQGKTAYGVNLDGTQDGGATERTCPHESFVGPAGERGVDNQYIRFLGCGLLRKVSKEVRSYELQNFLVNRLLLQISGVGDERNDGAVDVAMYHGRDPLSVDAAGKVVPWQSQRIDAGPHSLIFSARGKLVDGVLTTEPVDVIWPYHGDEWRLLIRGMTLRLNLTPTGAEGLRVGYIDMEQLWQGFSRMGEVWGTFWPASGPSSYAAMHRLADGYRDPRTGACTALSSATRYEFVRAHIIHPSRGVNP